VWGEGVRCVHVVRGREWRMWCVLNVEGRVWLGRSAFG
jgi:hypothetical protein